MRRTNYLGIKSGATHLQRDLSIDDILSPVIYRLPLTTIFKNPLYYGTPSTMALPSFRKETFEDASEHGGKESKARDAHSSMAQKNSAAWVLEPQVACSPLRAW